MQHIIKLAPKRVVYVSCNPATLARDSEALISAGYQIQRLAMLDMFPHTGHLESMVLFEHIDTLNNSSCRTKRSGVLNSVALAPKGRGRRPSNAANE
jgi:23S rRNA (uracil1939-C5)-methyltransferase